ncbi:hypothetical protein GW17_00053865 [Ensete ventricosum]|nr:hypothetical protein GW17_00053865 [Ensete ventricosum]
MDDCGRAANAALIPSVRTIVDSKLGVITVGDRPPWNSIGVPSSNLILKGYRKYSSIDDKNRVLQGYFIGLLTVFIRGLLLQDFYS